MRNKVILLIASSVFVLIADSYSKPPDHTMIGPPANIVRVYADQALDTTVYVAPANQVYQVAHENRFTEIFRHADKAFYVDMTSGRLNRWRTRALPKDPTDPPTNNHRRIDAVRLC